MSKPHKPEWMIVYTTPHLTDAQIVVGRLQHEGIPALADYMTGRDAIGITIGNWGECRVLVHPNNYDAAMEILFPDTPELADGEYDDDIIYYDDWNADDDDE